MLANHTLGFIQISALFVLLFFFKFPKKANNNSDANIIASDIRRKSPLRKHREQIKASASVRP